MELILFSLTFLLLLIGSITDLRRREVPDFVSYVGVALGIGLNLIWSVYLWDFGFVLHSLFGLLFFFALGCLLYYTGQWGGGDAKVLMAVGSLIGLELSLKSTFISFLINLLIITAVYSIVWLSFLAWRNWKKVRNEFESQVSSFKNFKSLNILLFTVFLIALFVSFTSWPMKYVTLLLSFSALCLFHFSFFINAIEKSCMQKLVKVEDLTEGDWIVKDVLIDSKRITGPKDLGISKDNIQELLKFRKQNKIEKVLVRFGVPLVPGFFVAWLITITYGSLLAIFI